MIIKCLVYVFRDHIYALKKGKKEVKLEKPVCEIKKFISNFLLQIINKIRLEFFQIKPF